MSLREVAAYFGVKFDTKELEKGEKHIESGIEALKGFGEAVAIGFGIEKVREFALGMVEQAAAIKDQSNELGISTKSLQEWTYAGQFAGVHAEQLNGIFLRMASAADKADEGGKGVAETLKHLGVDVKGPNGQLKDAGSLFEETGFALAGMTDKTEAMSKAAQLFGRVNAPHILSLFGKGKPALEELRKEFEKLGGAFDDEFIDKAHDVDEQMKRLGVAFTGVKVMLAGLLLPAVQSIATWFTKTSVGLRKVNEEATIARTGMIALGLAGIGAASKMIEKAGGFKAALGGVKLGLLALAADDVWTFYKGGKSLTGDFIDFIGGPNGAKIVRTGLHRIGAAVGEFFDELHHHPARFSDAMEHAMSDVRHSFEMPLNLALFDEFMYAVDLMTGGWDNFKAKLSAGSDAIVLVFDIAMTAVKYAGMTAAAYVQDAFTNAWNSIKASIASGINTVTGFLEGLPGTEGIVKSLQGAATSVGAGTGTEGAGHAVSDVQAWYANQKAGQVADYGKIAGQLGQGLKPNVGVQQQTNNITVQVSPNTPAAMAQELAGAVQKGVWSANRTAGAALVQRAP